MWVESVLVVDDQIVDAAELDGWMLTVGACEQDARIASSRTHDDPAFRAAVVRQRRNILHELEPEDIHEEVDRRLVLAHNQRDEMEV